jgi:hypothetical protein
MKISFHHQLLLIVRGVTVFPAIFTGIKRARGHADSGPNFKLSITIFTIVEFCNVGANGDNSTGELVRTHHGQIARKIFRCKDGICMTVTRRADFDKKLLTLRGGWSHFTSDVFQIFFSTR